MSLGWLKRLLAKHQPATGKKGRWDDASLASALMDQVLSDAVRRGASEIRLEPGKPEACESSTELDGLLGAPEEPEDEGRAYLVRCRVAGELRTVLRLPRNLGEPLTRCVASRFEPDPSEKPSPRRGRMTSVIDQGGTMKEAAFEVVIGQAPEGETITLHPVTGSGHRGEG